MKELNSRMKINELINFINANGGAMIATDVESVCMYQDIIGHSTIEENADASNGENKELFYRIYGIAYGTVAAIKFHCQYSNKICELIDTKNDFEAALDIKTAEVIQANKKISELIDEKNKLSFELADANNRLKGYENTVKELKVKLYDLMTQ